MKIVYTDVLVIGGGLAGLRMGIGAKREDAWGTNFKGRSDAGGNKHADARAAFTLFKP